MEKITTGDMMLVALRAFAKSARADAVNAVDALQSYPVYSDTELMKIFSSISELVYNKHCPSVIDEWTLLMHLEGALGGTGYHETLDRMHAAMQRHPHYEGQPLKAALLLIQLQKKHKAIRILIDSASSLNRAEDIEAQLSETADQVSELAIGYRPPATREEIIDGTMEEIEAVRRGDEDYGLELGVAPPSEGASMLKRHVVLKPGKLYVLGGLKKTGKTKLLTYILMNQAAKKIPTSFVSLEMSDRQVIRWTLGAMAQVNTGRIPSRSMTDNEYNLLLQSAQMLKRMPYDVYYHPGVSANVVKHHIMRHRALNPEGRIVIGIDHLHLMDHRQMRSESEVSAISRSVTDILHATQEANAITLLLGQLSNAAEREKYPNISHLKGAGAIGECAEGVYLLKNWARGNNNDDAREDGKVKLTMGITQRDGESGLQAKLLGDLATGRFYEVAA